MESSHPTSPDPERVRRLRDALLKNEELADDLTLLAAGEVDDSMAPPPPAGAPAALTEGRAFGKYRLVRELGRGGMGVVYLAVDTELDREVALKMARVRAGDDPELVSRLLREARTAARLEHPGIVPIHEVGEINGIPYFSMAYVQGRPLGDVIAEGEALDLRERTRLVHAVAEAVAHAHERRVIHRDLKPSNVLIDTAGGVHVLDFGLARHLDERAHLTREGQVLGTPHYMAPEQIDGTVGPVGPATDVHALGLLLFEALVGKPPFSGTSIIEVFAKVLREETPSPHARNPRVPGDLETICLKALEKVPRLRYPTAREMADDLGRFLKGEAIQARREGRWEKALRWVRKRKALTALASVVLVALVLMGWLAIDRHRLGQERLRDLRSIAPLMVDGTLLVRRAGGSMDDAERRFLGPLEAAAREVSRLDPDLPDPHYYLGRMYRALLRFDEALREQTMAVDRDPGHAPSLYERAILNVRRYHERKGGLREERLREEGRRLAQSGLLGRGGLEDAQVPGADGGEADRTDATLRALERAITADIERLSTSAGVEPGRLACAQGLLSTVRGSWEQGRARLEEAIAQDSTLEEAYEGLTMGALDRDSTEEAAEWATRGLEVDRGYVPHVIHLAEAQASSGYGKFERGLDPIEDYRAAVATLEEAIRLDPSLQEARITRAHLFAEWAFCVDDRGGNPTDLFERSVEAFDEVLRADPRCAGALEGRGVARGQWGWYCMDHNEDPKALLAGAIRDLEAACALGDGVPSRMRGRAEARLAWAVFQESRSDDATRSFELAISDYDAALTGDPADPYALIGRARARVGLAIARMVREQDPEPLFSDGMEDFQAVLARWPGLVDARLGRASGHIQKGDLLKDRGQDPGPCYRAAIDDMDQLLLVAPTSDAALVIKARAEIGCGRYVQAIRDLDSAIAVDPDLGEAYWCRGAAHVLRREWSAALSDFERGAELAPSYAEEFKELLEEARRH